MSTRLNQRVKPGQDVSALLDAYPGRQNPRARGSRWYRPQIARRHRAGQHRIKKSIPESAGHGHQGDSLRDDG